MTPAKIRRTILRRVNFIRKSKLITIKYRAGGGNRTLVST
jgi:hypothetical protein